MRSEEEVISAIERYSDMVKRICMVHLKSYSDSEDIFQNVFLKYALNDTVFETREHEKAWLIRVTVNACKDLLKSFFKSKTVPLDVLNEQTVDFEENSRFVLETVLSLPEKYKDAVYLYYYEGYSAVEISNILGKSVNTVYTWLSRAKKMLREKLGGDDLE